MVRAKGRGSKEAVDKRRAARELNAVFESAERTAMRDGRVERRRRRLMAELKDGRGGQPLSPIETVTHVDELLRMGETFRSLREHGVRPRRAALSPQAHAAVRRAQAAYAFDPRAWRILGLPPDAATAGPGDVMAGKNAPARPRRREARADLPAKSKGGT